MLEWRPKIASRFIWITIWVSSISFDTYADIASEGTADVCCTDCVKCCKGGKGITDLKLALEVWIDYHFISPVQFTMLLVLMISWYCSLESFGEIYVDSLEEFLQTFSTQRIS
ncbi:probable histone acetyltransferase type B catalytic subunit [Rosa rugosa]|uniref:probable histone acetyltransferase type B catalytic subunit n=1 Tax=Rosa rugosa TaxID=74645 RepID=UPI002B410786|nr:probable histone acetyltransferase type B catalytic subunit [Rosa rugosa]